MTEAADLPPQMPVLVPGDAAVNDEPRRLTGRRILLAEDGIDNQRLFQMQLRDAGASVSSALNGQIAVELAALESFDLILMDMQMPVMDGYSATLELRRREVATPIVALTAHAMAEDREKCIACGCTDYLSKPVSEETLLKTVHQYLTKGQSAPFLEPARVTPAPTPPSVIVPRDSSNRIKCSKFADLRIMEIVPGFVAKLPGKVRQMEDLVESFSDLAALQRIAHQLLGTCGGYGFEPVALPARKVERSIMGGSSREVITADVNALIEVIRSIEGYDESSVMVASLSPNSCCTV